MKIVNTILNLSINFIANNGHQLIHVVAKRDFYFENHATLQCFQYNNVHVQRE